jgi:hypothetical protein
MLLESSGATPSAVNGHLKRAFVEAKTRSERPREVDQGAAQAGEAMLLLGTVAGGELGHLDQVLARREGVLAAGEHDDSDAGVVGGSEESLGGAVPHLGVHCVLGLGAPERDGANPAIVDDVDHQNRPPSTRNCCAVHAAPSSAARKRIIWTNSLA